MRGNGIKQQQHTHTRTTFFFFTQQGINLNPPHFFFWILRRRKKNFVLLVLCGDTLNKKTSFSERDENFIFFFLFSQGAKKRFALRSQHSRAHTQPGEKKTKRFKIVIFFCVCFFSFCSLVELPSRKTKTKHFGF